MAKKSSENYLDELLYSLGNTDTSSKENVEDESVSVVQNDASFDTQLQADAPVGMSDEDFLKDFESDFGITDDDSFLSDFEDDFGITKDGGDRDFGTKKDVNLDDDLFGDLDDFLSDLDEPLVKEPDLLDDGLPNISDVIDLNSLDTEFTDESASTTVEQQSVQPEAAATPVAEPDLSIEQDMPAVSAIEPEVSLEPEASSTPAVEPELSLDAEATASPVAEPDLSLDDLSLDVPSTQPEMPLTEAGEPDLAGIDSDDLLSMLSGTEGMEGIGDLLEKEEDGTSVEEKDSIGEFAERQMNGDDEGTAGIEEESEDTGKKKKKKKEKKQKGEGEEGEKKPGFFARLFNKLLESDEDEDSEEISLTPAEGPAVEELSEENMALLRELEGADAGNEKEEDDKKKKKKEKKEKPKKEKKEKPKKEKKPKEKKVKEPKPKGKPLPKKPVAFLVLMGISFVVLVMVFTNLTGYSVPINQAKAIYNAGVSDPNKYVEAFGLIDGMSIKKGDEQFYNKTLIMSQVASEYNHYVIFKKANENVISEDKMDSRVVEQFDAIVCAAGRYYTNRESAAECECSNELEMLANRISEALKEDYGMTMEEANTIYKSRTRKKYTEAIYRKLRELGLYKW